MGRKRKELSEEEEEEEVQEEIQEEDEEEEEDDGKKKKGKKTPSKKAKTESAPKKSPAAPKGKAKEDGAEAADVLSKEMPTSYSFPPPIPGQLKIVSYNLDGFRAAFKNKCMDYVAAEDPDVVCFQETKISDDSIPSNLLHDKYPHQYWSCSQAKKGYAGTALLSKVKPISLTYGIGKSEHDQEGRTITAEFDSFYLVNTYVPNAGQKLERLAYRGTWDEALQDYLVGLDKKKPVIWTGDLNVAHNEIDLSNPKTNKKTAGFTQQERDSFGKFLGKGFVDSFRHLNPDKAGQFSFWGKRFNARGKNIGWRLDYFVVSQRFLEKVQDNLIRSDVWGASDHVPIVLLLKSA